MFHGPDHLNPAHGAVAQRADGRWFVTLGNPGFNTRANNRDGFATREAALECVVAHVAAQAQRDAMHARVSMSNAASQD